MRILTAENISYDLDQVPEQVDDLQYCVLEGVDPDWLDYQWYPLIFLESFHAPAICLQIGDYHMQMPMDWSMMICDEELTSVEIVELASLSNRGFHALIYNPMYTNHAHSVSLEITNIYQDVVWYFPKLKHGHVLAVPLTSGPNPQCAYFVKEANRVCDLDLAELLS